MSSSGGRKFTGAAIVVLALFGVGGALVDKMRNTQEQVPGVDTIPVQSIKSGSELGLPGQKPSFEGVDLALDGTGSVAGKAIPGGQIILYLDGKPVKTAEVGKDGDFSIDQNTPLSSGNHELQLKSIGPKGMEPLSSDQAIKVSVANGKVNTVVFTEPGQPPVTLPGIEQISEDGSSFDKVEEMHRSTAKTEHASGAAGLIKTTMKTVDSTHNIPTVQSLLKVAVKEKEVDAQNATSKPAMASSAKDITFVKLEYVATNDKSGDIIVDGKSRAGASLRLLIDGKKVGKAIADPKGNWSLKATQYLAPGAHWLVAEQLDATGKLIARAESPFDRADKPVTSANSKPSGKLDKAAQNEVMETVQNELGATKKDVPTSASSTPAKSDSGMSEQPASKTVKTADAKQANREKTGAKTAGDEKNLWDKFTDIFKVDPAKTGGDTKTAGQAKPKTDKVTGVKAKVSSNTEKMGSANSLVFESLVFRDNSDAAALELSGRAEPGSHIRLFMGQKQLGEVVANSEGVWTYTQKGKIRPGAYLFKAAQVLKNGRIASEIRMPYSHVITKRMAAGERAEPNASAPTNTAEPSLAEQRDHPTPKRTIASRNARLKRPSRARSTYRRPLRVNRVRRSRKTPVGNRVKATKVKRVVRRPRRNRYSSTIRKKRIHTARYVKRTKRKSRRRSRRAKSVARYYLNPKNKARYIAKRKLYPRSRKTPARPRVARGTTLWGYSAHYYGRGRLYPHIRRANRRKIRNPNRIFVGQRIRIPKLRTKRRIRR